MAALLEKPVPRALRVEHATKYFGPLKAVDNVSLDVEAGAFVALLGPSGCGKTTLMRLIAGFDTPDAGVFLLMAKTSRTCRRISGPSI